MNHPLTRLFDPRAIAIVGATEDVRRPGGQALKSLTTSGYAGEVYAVNPRYRAIDGRPCFGSIAEIPATCDLAVIAVPAAEVPATLEACGQKGISHAVILSAGFREIGERGVQLESQLQAALKNSGVAAVGPNCIGMMNLRNRVFAGFGASFRKTDWRGGPVAMLSQSGGFAYSLMTYCDEAGIGFDHMVSTGNEASLGLLDFIEYFLEDAETRLIAVYMEGIHDGRRLRALGRRALELGKPIAVWKVGNTTAGQRAAASHTANLTVDYDWYRDAFREGGFVEIHEIYDLIDCARVFASNKRPRGNRCAVVTTSGGAGVLLTDACEHHGLTLPPLEERTFGRLRTVVPDFASLANPVDVTAALAQKEAEFTIAQQAVWDDPGVDMLILRSYPGRDAPVWAAHLAEASRCTDKPVLVSLTGTISESGGWLPLLTQAGIPCFETPSRVVYAASVLREFVRRCDSAGNDAKQVRPGIPGRVEWPATFDEVEAKLVLESYGISTPRRTLLETDGELSLARHDFTFPVVLKVVSADLPHKTEVGGVTVGIEDRLQLAQAIDAMRQRLHERAPRVRIRGWLVEQMVPGVELIVGALYNPSFGPCVMVGLGGVHAEILRDVVRAYAPVSPQDARELVLRLKGVALLTGYRGQPRCDIGALADVISRVSWLITDHAVHIGELEINPLIVRADGLGAVAVDAMLRPRAT